MLIEVVYNDNKHDMVDPFLLDELITSGKIKRFLRSEGWATIGSDPIRGTGGLYKGPERRNYSLLKFLKVEEKTKEQLNNELIELRKRTTELETSEIKLKEIENALQRSEERFRQIAESSGEFIWEVDVHGFYTYANPIVEEILGYRPEELIGKKHFYDFFHPDIRETFKKAAFEVFAKKAVFRNFINPNVHKNGNTVILETSGLPVLDSTGNLLGYRGSNRDMTLRKKAEVALRESEERYRRMVSTVTAYTYSVGVSEGVAVSTQHSIGCFQVTGYNPEDYESDSYLWYKMIYPDDKMIVETSVKEVLAGHEVSPMEHRIIRRDGKVVWVRNTIVPSYDVNGHLTRYDGMIEDITERKLAEEKIQKLNKELEQKVFDLIEANKELEAFNRSVSHDLQTPLFVIGGFSRRFLKICGNKLNNNEIDMINTIQMSAQKMERIIKDLLLFSRSGRKDIKSVKNDMWNLMTTVLDEFKPLSEGRMIKFDIKALPPAYGDIGLIKQVLINLLSNAIKFTRSKDMAVIEVGCKVEENENIYYIRDNGIGFDSQDTEKIFTPFSRLSEARDFEGTGVGLSIVERIIKRHGGKVWAEGKINEGATFYFSLPHISNSNH
ncbi:MAG: GSU3473 family protein [Nitrospirota bacterium]